MPRALLAQRNVPSVPHIWIPPQADGGPPPVKHRAAPTHHCASDMLRIGAFVRPGF